MEMPVKFNPMNSVIDWNVRQFYRALKEDRLDDAARYRDNVVKYLEGNND